MSKKKATMTLKDFHGGSIPSDLPLPSAPGVIVRPSERSGFDRQSAWGNPAGWSDHRLRPGSAGSRNLDDKTPFLPHSTQLGRNFDEDERRPLDGPSDPHRTVSDESLHTLPSRAVEPKIDVSAHGRITNQPSSTLGSQYSTGTVSGSYAGRFAEMKNVGVNSLVVGGSSGGARLSYNNASGSGVHTVSAPHPNAWGLRKDTATVKETAPAPWYAPDAALKLAHASALQKVSSGRWHSKPQNNSQTDIEIIRQPETETDFHFRHKGTYSKNDYTSGDIVGRMEYDNAALARQVGKSLTLDDNIHTGEALTSERSRNPMTMEANERNSGIQQLHRTGRPDGTELQSAPQSELSERPKLRLLPRSKPVENPEAQMENKLVQQQPTIPVPVQLENQNLSHGVSNPSKAGHLGPESGHSIIEHPKLNLKPRSEPLDTAEVNTENKRNTPFGGARPRELVLNERGSDNVAVNNDDLVQSSGRVIQEVIKAERVPVHATPTRYSGKHENNPVEHRTGKSTDRREHKLEGEEADGQRKNWRGENWRNKREFDKSQRQQQQQQQERPPSPDTWRKPAEQAKLTPSDAQGVRFGKAASAVELAQAFSRPVSDPTTADRTSGQRNLPGRGQIPFSRLTGPAGPRP